MNRRYKSGAFRAIHESAVAKFEIGAISKERMLEYDEACLVKPAAPVPRTATQEPAVLPHSGAPVYARGNNTALAPAFSMR
jgi:putative transcriptional regulator